LIYNKIEINSEYLYTIFNYRPVSIYKIIIRVTKKMDNMEKSSKVQNHNSNIQNSAA